MNPQGFSFPPPPPPPPTQQHQPHQQQYPNNAGFTPYGQGHHGQRGGRGNGGHFRGRGRGYGNRGGGRGGLFMPSDSDRSGVYTPNTSVGYGPMTYPNFTPQAQQAISAPHFTAPPSRNYQPHQNQASFASSRPYSQTAAGSRPPYQHQPSYDAPYTTPATQQTPAYSPVVPSHQPQHQHVSPTVQPAMMGPPMRWGFEKNANQAQFAGSQRGNQRGSRPFNGYNPQNIPGDRSGKYAGKRDHSSAFGKPQSSAPRTPAPPAVPSFGNPLPSKPPAPADATRKPKKKKRKHNQLGLTPKTEEHESSEEEDDVDEEQKLAAGGSVVSGPLLVTYRGQTSKLQTPEEIAAWIEERKKRFPTQAKIEERKKAMEEAKKAREEAQRQQKDSRKQMGKREKKEQEKRGHKEQPAEATDPIDAAAKAKRKADKLRRRLMKEEKRIAQAEADAERARIKGEDTNAIATQNPTKEDRPGPIFCENADVASNQGIEPESASCVSTEPSGTGIVPPAAEPGIEAVPLEAGNEHGLSDLSSDISDSDWTSSSGSDLSSSDSEDSDDDSPPEQATSRREGPERVPPPPRESKRGICRHFARNGRCSRGDTCKFLHEKSSREVKTKPLEKKEKGRKGLLQALLDRQKEEENRRAMEMIMWLGENGYLADPKTQEDTPSESALNQSNTSSQGQSEVITRATTERITVHGQEAVTPAERV